MEKLGNFSSIHDIASRLDFMAGLLENTKGAAKNAPPLSSCDLNRLLLCGPNQRATTDMASSEWTIRGRNGR
jgi:hypothetical protein